MNAYYGQGQEDNAGKHKNQANLGGQVTAEYFLNLHLCSFFELYFKIVYPYPYLKPALPSPVSSTSPNLDCPEGLKGIIRAAPTPSFLEPQPEPSGVPLPGPRGQHS